MKTILVVDDDPTILKLVSEVLSGAGYTVNTAKDGIDGMLALKKTEHDLLILDIMMPEMNGYDVCHSLKFNPEFKKLPILLLTSREEELDPRLESLMGISYMHKSCSPRELLEQVSRIVPLN